MFPGIRLLFVSTLASIVAIACGLGLLAAFGVNHGPFARLQNGSPPLQLVFDHTMRVPVAAAAPFGVRFDLAANATGGAATPNAVPSVASSGTISPVSVTAIESASAPAPVSVAPSEPIAPVATSDTIAVPPAVSESAVLSAPAVPSPAPASVVASGSVVAPVPVASPDPAAASSSLATSQEAGHQADDTAQHAASSSTDQPISDNKTRTDNAPPVVAKVAGAAPASEKAKRAHAEPRRRRVVRRVVRPEVAATQAATTAQPTYEWVTQTPAKVVTRRRMTKKTAAQHAAIGTTGR